MVTGLAAGLVLALLRSLGIRPLNWLIIFVVDLFRSLPPLVIIVLIYFGLPAAGISPSGFVSTWLSLALVLMAFSEEIFWAGITSIAKGQWEAARSTGLSLRPDARSTWCCRRRCGSPSRRSPTAPSPSPRAPRSAPSWRVSEILGRRARRCPTRYNPSPLMMGAAAYLVLFLPVVVLRPLDRDAGSRGSDDRRPSSTSRSSPRPGRSCCTGLLEHRRCCR